MPFETPGNYACDSEILEFSSKLLKWPCGRAGFPWPTVFIWLVSVNDLFFFLILIKIKKGCVLQVRVGWYVGRTLRWLTKKTVIDLWHLV